MSDYPPNTNPPDPNFPNLRPWKPGQSGNPKGRPRKLTLSEKVDKLLRNTRSNVKVERGPGVPPATVPMKDIDIVAMQIAQAMKRGNFRAIEFFADRRDPRVKTVEDDGGDAPRMVNLPAGGPWGGKAKNKPPEPAAAPAPAAEPAK